MSRTTVSEFAFLKKFDTEAKAVAFYEAYRWPEQRTCPRCQSHDTYSHHARSHYYHCRYCRKQFSCKTETVMHSSPLPVRMWLYTMYKVSVARKGVSSLQLAKEIGVTQKSAWHMLHRLKEACGNESGPLSGVIEIDETYVGGKARNKHASKRVKDAGRGSVEKQPVLGMRERGGQTRAMPIEGTDRLSLHTEIRAHVATGSTICTDDHSSYARLHRIGYEHDSVKHSANAYVKGQVHTNGIEAVWAVLKRSLMGTYHHVSMKHLHRYVNEATFRLNEGKVDRMLFDRIGSLCALSVGRRLPYKVLTS